ncbi:MAG: transporter substrate-binding domain-containing protein, partial [Paraglaciecola sp.]|nr:transporter substrate-binding domain-containing protein [Paraglaciecola sp.]
MDKTSAFISPMNIRFTVRFTVICLLAAVCCSIAALTVFLQYHYSTQQLEKLVLKQFEQVVIDTKSSLQDTDSQAKLLVDLLAVYPDVLRHSEPTLVRLMSEMIKTSPVVYGIYFGRADGSFFEVINLNIDSAKEAYFSELNDAWVTLSIDAKKSNQTQILTYYDADLNQTNQVSQNTSYNPTKRPWYVQAKGHTTRGQPYLFQLSQQPGITYSRRLTHGQGVVGLDISLSNLSQRLAKYAEIFEGEAYLIKKNGELIAQYNNTQQGNSVQSITPLTLTEIERQTISQLGTLTISNVSDWQPIDFSLSGMPTGYGVDVLKLIAEKLGLQINFINGYVWADFVKQFGQNDIALLNGVFDNQENRELGLLSDPYGNLPLGLVV